MAQPVVQPPVTYVSLVSNYPSPRAKRERKPLSEVLTPNQPAVLHLFTGWGGCWPCAEQCDDWARRFKGKASFLLVSCDGPGLAETFATRLKLKDCTISYIGSDNDMPAWGQLGCNGFIVLDSSHSVVCRATTAYQQVGPRAAFGHVETLLSALIDKKSSGGVPPALPGPTIPAGETVRLHGLKSRADLNGTYGVCVQGPEGDPEGRCVVRLTDGTPLRIRMDNLTVISEPAGKAQGGGCGPGGCGEVAKAKDCGVELAEGCFDGGSWHKSSRAPPPVENVKRSRETVAADERAAAEPTTPTAEDDVLVAPLQPTTTVLVAALDADHAACEAALEQLRTRRDGASAALVLKAYEAHFAREEALLDAHLYQAAAAAEAAEVAARHGAGVSAVVSAFSAEASARASHRNDHKRMLTDLRKAMHACAIADDARVPVALADRMLREFERHAATYDAAYAERLSHALGAQAVQLM